MSTLTECPNCGSVWSPGTEEWEWQQCHCCGYPDCDFDSDEDDFEEDNYPDEGDILYH